MLIALELLFQVLPVSTATHTGYHLDPLIITYPPGHSWRTSTGWDLRNAQQMSANNLGFASDIDYVPNHDAIAVIGDSYVEAGSLDAVDRPAAQLAVALPRKRPVYAMGGPGSALLDYAERVRLASERLGVRDFVVLMEAGDVRQSLCGSGNIHGPCLDRQSLQPRVELAPGPSLAKRILRNSALAQYVVGQLKVDGSRLASQMFVHPTPVSIPKQSAAGKVALSPSGESLEVKAQRLAMVTAVADAFFARVSPYAKGRLVFVIDGRRRREALIDSTAAMSPLLLERDLFIDIARRHGATVVDAEPLYLGHWQHSTLSLDVGPYDGHLNRLGVKLLMSAAAQTFQ